MELKPGDVLYQARAVMQNVSGLTDAAGRDARVPHSVEVITFQVQSVSEKRVHLWTPGQPWRVVPPGRLEAEGYSPTEGGAFALFLRAREDVVAHLMRAITTQRALGEIARARALEIAGIKEARSAVPAVQTKARP